MMVEDNQEKHRTAYTVTCDYKYGECDSLQNRPSSPCFPADLLRCRNHHRHLSARSRPHCRQARGSLLSAGRLLSPRSSCTIARRRWWCARSERPHRGFRRCVLRPSRFEPLPLILLPSPDLCKLAGLPPAGIICELVKPDDPLGGMARRDDCFAFARDWGLKMISIEQLETYRRSNGL
jgi:hypothetical protein